jgi:hypothetical protein
VKLLHVCVSIRAGPEKGAEQNLPSAESQNWAAGSKQPAIGFADRLDFGALISAAEKPLMNASCLQLI